jgi:hypothetical protein
LYKLASKTFKSLQEYRFEYIRTTRSLALVVFIASLLQAMRIAASASLIRAGSSTASSIATATTTARMVSTSRPRKQQGFKPQRLEKDDFAETPDSATYRHQHTLPHLPIPTLESTAAKYLESTRPFVSDLSPHAPVAGDEHPTKAYERTKAAVKDFVESPLVKELQKRLQEHAKGKDSWLIDWFNTGSYFGALKASLYAILCYQRLQSVLFYRLP